MTRAVLRNATLIIGLIVAMLICAAAAPFLTSMRGASGPGVFQSASPFAASLAVLVFFSIAVALCIPVGRILNTAVALFVLGSGLFALSHRTDGMRELIFAGSFDLIWLETIIWSALILSAAFVLFRWSGPLEDVEPTEEGRTPHPFTSVLAWQGAAAGVLVLPVVWFIAQSPMKGQVLAATTIGAMVAGLVGRLLSPHVQPILLFATPCLFGALGHLAAMMFAGYGPDLAETFVNEQLWPISRPMPLDYAAGSLMGVALGLGWAKSFLHSEDDE